MAETSMYVALKGRGSDPHGRLSLYRNGIMYGGSVDREGILTVLLNVIRKSPGRYEVIDTDSNEVLLTYDTDQPVWNMITVGEHESRMPMSPKHGWVRSSFTTDDEPDADSTFHGYHRGDTWNGWLQPHMERSEIERLISYIDCPDEYQFTWKYGQLIVDSLCSEHVEVINPQAVLVDGRERMLYDMSLGWCWEEVEAKGGSR